MIDMISDYMEVSLILLAVLFTYLTLTVIRLSRTENKSSYADDASGELFESRYSFAEKDDVYEVRMESMKKAQTFAGMQLVDLKRKVNDSQIQELDWLQEAISLYLIGAVDLIGKEAHCSPASRRKLINFILKSNLHLDQEHASRHFSEALNREPSDDKDNMIRAGAKAAKAWLSQKSVPSDFSLKTRVDDWGIFA